MFQILKVDFYILSVTIYGEQDIIYQKENCSVYIRVCDKIYH